MVSLTGFCFEVLLLSGPELVVSLSPVSLLLTAIPDSSFNRCGYVSAFPYRGPGRSRGYVTHVSIPQTLMPEGNKSRVSGDGLESNRQATNSPGIQVDSSRFDCLDEKVGLGVEP